MTSPKRLAAMVVVLAASGCSSGMPPTKARQDPVRAEIAEHDRLATLHERAAIVESAEYHPTRDIALQPCQSSPDGVCWKRVENPTRWHAIEAARHRHAAALHRALSQKLEATLAASER